MKTTKIVKIVIIVPDISFEKENLLAPQGPSRKKNLAKPMDTVVS